jgi:hydroxymethylpyrimidine pyrophosphatase-like HAD family hydrolase
MKLHEKGRHEMKLLVTDIDGTLTAGNSVPGPVIEACGRLRRAGWRLMIATGRIWASARPFAEAIASDLPAIVYDGARIMDGRGGKAPFREWRISSRVAGEILSMGWESSLLVQAYGDEEVTCRPSDEVTRRFFRGLGVVVRPDLASPKLSFNPYRIIYYGDPVEARELGKRIRISMKGRVEVTLAGEGFLDILPPGVSKGAALRAFLEDSGLQVGRIVAAGDHLNDVGLLREADLAVTFRGAPIEVIESAHLVLPPASSMGFIELCSFLEESGDEIGSDPFPTGAGLTYRRGRPLHLGTSPA